jgi:hypothetical protein
MSYRRRLAGFAGGLVLALSVAVAVAAHEGSEAASLSVEPDNLQAGGSVMLVGSGLEPNEARILVLAGPGMTIELGTVTTDDEGMFQKEIQIPAHMPGGSYEVRAIGDETLTVALALTAAEGGLAAGSGSEDLETVIPHERHVLELGLIGGTALLLFLIGTGLIRFAERFAAADLPVEAD